MKFPSFQMKLLKRKFGSPGEPSPGSWCSHLLLFPVMRRSRRCSGFLQVLLRCSFLSSEICNNRCLTCHSIAKDSASCSLRLAVCNLQASSLETEVCPVGGPLFTLPPLTGWRVSVGCGVTWAGPSLLVLLGVTTGPCTAFLLILMKMPICI